MQDTSVYDTLLDGIVEEIRTRYRPSITARQRYATGLGNVFKGRHYYCLRIPWEDSKAQSPPIPNWTVQNPCHEIPQDYEVYVYFEGSTMFINNQNWPMDMADPNFVENFVRLFGDLDRLREQIREHHGVKAEESNDSNR